MKIFEIIDSPLLEHLYKVQKARSYEFLLFLKKYMSVTPAVIPPAWYDQIKIQVWRSSTGNKFWVNWEQKAFTWTKDWTFFDDHPNARIKLYRMINAKKKYEEAGGKYDN